MTCALMGVITLNKATSIITEKRRASALHRGTLDLPIIVGHNNPLESMLILIMIIVGPH